MVYLVETIEEGEEGRGCGRSSIMGIMEYRIAGMNYVLEVILWTLFCFGQVPSTSE